MTASADRRTARPQDSFVTAVFFLAMVLAQGLTIRAVNTWHLHAAGALDGSLLGPPFSLPFLLGEDLAVGLVLAAMLWGTGRVRFLRGVGLVVAGAYLLLLAADQMAFKVFFSHVDYALWADCHDLVALWSSIVETADTFFCVHALLAVAGAVSLWLRWRPHFVVCLAEAVRKRPLAAWLGAMGYGAATVAMSFAADQKGLERSFPVAWILSWARVESEETRDLNAPPRPIPVGERPDATARRTADTSRVADERADELARTREAIAAYEGKLNLVWYLMESASYHETSLDPGNRYDTTPFLRDLARRSLVFKNYYASVAASTRSFFSSLTGIWPYNDRTSDLTRYSMIALPTLPDILHDEGYQTAFFASSDTIFDQLDTFLVNRKLDRIMDVNLLTDEERRRSEGTSWGVDEEIMIDRALAWIAEAKDQGRPFYVSYNAVYPHHPFGVPRRHADIRAMDWGPEGVRSRYRASLRYADRALERFHDGLESLGVLDGTLFVVVPDHGETHGDRHPRNIIHAEQAYEEAQHIFLVLHNPRALGPPAVSERVACQVDFLPTILDVLRVRRDLDIDGQSLVSADWRERPIFFYSRKQYAVRDGRYKYIENREGGPPELYDLSNDPREKKNIASEGPERVAALAGILDEWRERVARRFRDLRERTGLSEKETSDLAMKKRRELFGDLGGALDLAYLCRPGACGTPGSGELVFGAGEPIALGLTWREPGPKRVRVEIYDESRKNLFREMFSFEESRDGNIVDLGGAALPGPGRYRMRVQVLVNFAVHETRTIRFEVR